MDKCHCGSPKLPEALNCGQARCMDLKHDLDAGREYRTWRFKMLLAANNYSELSKDRYMEAFAAQRRIARQVMHENLGRRYEQMRIEDRLEKEQA